MYNTLHTEDNINRFRSLYLKAFVVAIPTPLIIIGLMAGGAA